MKRALPVLLLTACFATAAQAADRDEAMFKRWARDTVTAPFEAHLQASGVASVVPLFELLRTATDWERCGGQPFEIPPSEQWPDVTSVLQLVAQLRTRGILGDFQVVSSYRNPALNQCAGGAPSSAHTRRFAVDILMKGEAANEQQLCDFWRTHGARYSMGLSRYPSGRIHIDTAGYRTWGADHTRATSFCALS